MAGLEAEGQRHYCELCISRTHVWKKLELTDVREQSLEFIYHNIV